MQWFRIEHLPKDRTDFDTPGKIGMRPNNFYNVVPFVNDIINYVNKERSNNIKKANKDPPVLHHTQSTPVFSNLESMSFTGESFLQMITNSPGKL